jgi:hypothetical protein
MDIEAFYDQDPRRRASEEVEFGTEWQQDGQRFELCWVADTGELYLMAEPDSRQELATASVTVEVVAVVHGRDNIESLLAGWRDEMGGPDSLTWVRARASGAQDPTS